MDLRNEEKVNGNKVIVSGEEGKLVLNTYISKEDCSPATGVEKFIKNAIKLANKNESSRPWIISKFEKDSIINDSILAIGEPVQFNDTIEPSGIKNIKKKKIKVR